MPNHGKHFRGQFQRRHGTHYRELNFQGIHTEKIWVGSLLWRNSFSYVKKGCWRPNGDWLELVGVLFRPGVSFFIIIIYAAWLRNLCLIFCKARQEGLCFIFIVEVWTKCQADHQILFYLIIRIPHPIHFLKKYHNNFMSIHIQVKQLSKDYARFKLVGKVTQRSYYLK